MIHPPHRLTAGLTAAGLILMLLAPLPAASQEWDPIEPVNRVFFALNDGLDFVLIEPAARGWYFVLRDPGTRAFDRFVTNLEFPIRFVGNLLQLRILRSGEELGRFVVNTTVGLVGFFDPASSLGIGLYGEDVGQAVGRWGVPAGPYLMVPLLGPSSGRDFVTGVADSFLMGPGSIVRSTLGNLNDRARFLDEIEEAKLASLDYYAFVRNAYVTTRQAQVEDREADLDEGLDTDDLYEIEDEDEIE